MRIELLYSPGCSSYKKALDTLEHIIAEERLPLPVELVEDHGYICGEPKVRIDGELLTQLGRKSHSYTSGYLDHVQEILCYKWKQLTLSSLKAPV
jgi:hypothetical protein